MAVSKRLRYEVLRRDNHACRYCGRSAPDVPLRVDHVIPQALGGSDAPANLVAACQDCNAGKTSSMPDAMAVADVDQATFRHAASLKAVERHEEERCNVVIEWVDAWCAARGEAPDLHLYEDVKEQVDAICGDGPPPARVMRAAIAAGARGSVSLHFGLTEADLEKSGGNRWWTRALEAWSASFRAAADRWPTLEERRALADHMRRVGTVGGFCVADVIAAAAAAGVYQDPDLTTCLPRYLSAVDAAAHPMPAADALCGGVN